MDSLPVEPQGKESPFPGFRSLPVSSQGPAGKRQQAQWTPAAGQGVSSDLGGCFVPDQWLEPSPRRMPCPRAHQETRREIKLGGQSYRCQGYRDPTAQSDPNLKPLSDPGNPTQMSCQTLWASQSLCKDHLEPRPS